MRCKFPFIVYLTLSVCIISSNSFSQTRTKKKISVSKKFFEVEQNIDELRKEMADLRKQIREMEIRTSVPEIRKEINKLINVPELTHEILLNNGTIVKGKVLHEDLDRIIIQTQIGLLTISKKEIKLTRPAEIPKAKCIIDGPITEKVHEDKRIFKGKIKNEGIRRADFPKIIFHLYDEATNLIASDSIFVRGNFHIYQSGVQTDAAIEPGQSFPFECSVEFPKGTSISYYIKKISWEEFE